MAARERAQRGLSSIEAELAAVRRSASIAGVDLEVIEEAAAEKHPPHSVSSNVSTRAPAEKTIKEATVEILKEATGGLTAKELLRVMRDRYGLDYPRSSLSPQLSRLKGDGILAREDGRWLLHDKAPQLLGGIFE